MKNKKIYIFLIPFHSCFSYCSFLSTTCVLLGLFSSLHLCSGKFGTPITDDVSKLSELKQNIPSDYEIPVSYVPEEVAGTCWVVLNIYPLERSLEKLAGMFGAMSSNRDDINVFITMLKSLRLTFDHEELETAMQVFQCHYRERSLLSGLYFDYIQDLLRAATQGTSSFSCKPQPCLNHQQTAGTPFICAWQFYSNGCQEESRKYRWLKSSSLLLVLIPFTACIVLIVWQVRRSCSFTLQTFVIINV
uniref:Kit ligand n=1 Tax=Poecilia mexicana TaxID=48701 RepID=A0A3B3YSM4_9TELE